MISFLLTFRRLWRGTRRSADDPEFRALLLVFVALIVSGTLFYRSVEGWSALDAMYFSVVAVTTVGFGDLSPQTSVGKLFTVIYLLVGIGVTVSLVAKLAAAQLRNEPFRPRRRETTAHGTDGDSDRSGVTERP